MGKFFAAGLAALALGGCASEIMKGYVGKPVSAVVEDYGMPSGSFQTNPGQRAFVWQMGRSIVIPGGTTGTATIVGNSIFSTSYTAPAMVGFHQCSYVLYATHTRTDIEGPAAWTVTSFKRPPLSCE